MCKQVYEALKGESLLKLCQLDGYEDLLSSKFETDDAHVSSTDHVQPQRKKNCMKCKHCGASALSICFVIRYCLDWLTNRINSACDIIIHSSSSSVFFLNTE